MQFLFDLDSKGYLKRRESAILEYKQNFQKGDNLLKYLKTLVGMANNKGGMIMFGIQDSPHIPLGMSNTRFQEIDPKEIDGRLREYFAPSIKWRSDILEKELDDCDVVLLGPQVAYILKDAKEMCEPLGISVGDIPGLDYGIGDGKRVLQYTLSLIEKDE